jgi:hypothetical protein
LYAGLEVFGDTEGTDRGQQLHDVGRTTGMGPLVFPLSNFVSALASRTWNVENQGSLSGSAGKWCAARRLITRAFSFAHVLADTTRRSDSSSTVLLLTGRLSAEK